MGVAFVSILFGIVVGLIVIEAAGEIVAFFDPDQEIREVRFWHLMVAIALTILSFLGYFASQNRPQHRIYFFNLPLWLFFLDVLMVFDYYIILQFTESPSSADTVTRADARPEAIAVAVAFFLYALWDLGSWRIASDAEYQKVIDGNVDKVYGPRRWVTLGFFVVFLVVAGITWLLDSSRDLTVIGIDLTLILLLVLYRVLKPLLDPGVKTRAPSDDVGSG